MEGGPQEADRLDELEYEVSRVARLGPAASCGSRPDACVPSCPGLTLWPSRHVSG